MGRRLTLKDYDLKVQGILDRMKSEATLFTEDSPDAKDKRKERAKIDRLWFARTYLPHYCYKPFGEFHLDLNKLLDVHGEMCFFAGPRESGKTTIDGLVAQLQDICFNLRHFEMLISETADAAADYAYFIMLEIEENERIKQDFGNLKGSYKWEKDDFVTKNNIRILSVGRGQSVKRSRWRQYRMDRIVVIDLETLKSTKNPKLVKETISWLAGEVRGGMAQNGSFLMEGQIIRKNCVLAQYLNQKDEAGGQKYKGRAWSALYDDDSRSYWPEGYTVEELNKRKKDMGLIEWNRWMQNRPEDEEGLFREAWIRYYHPNEIKGRHLRTVAAFDPSPTSKESNDFKALITISKDKDSIGYVRNAFIKHTTPRGLVSACYNRYEQFYPAMIGGEENSLKEYLWDTFDQYAKDKGYHLPLKPINNTMSKEDRISRLSALIEMGKIRFLKGDSDQDLLVEQLIFFGHPGVHDDGPDGLEMALRISEQVADLVVAL